LTDKAFYFGLDEKPFVCKAFSVNLPEDGTYDVMVLEALPGPLGDDTRLELTFTSGLHKGDVVWLQAAHLGRDPLSLLGLPGTLTVIGGVPSLLFD
jgi:hypothetical protein